MKAKTKTKLIMVVNALLGVVFAFMLGWTYCAGNILKNERSNYYATAAYLANNNYEMVNATLENPIAFGDGAKITEVALSYAMCYDFDVKFTYELVWMNGTTETTLSTDNVILNYANRSRFIVDENYIYLNESISAGKGSLTIFTGVDFIDTTDETYYGKSLKIKMDVEIEKQVVSTAYTSEHKLYEDSIAGKAWIKLRSETTISGADVIVYNARYSTDTGIVHPNGYTAYNGTEKLFGNKFYAGAGLYIMTGATDVTITVQSLGSWEPISDNVETKTSAFDNNIYYNFDPLWGASTHTDNDTINSITIAANSTVYVNIYESIEITSVGHTDANFINYSDYRLVSSFYINGGDAVGSEKIEAINIASSGTGESSYTEADYSIINSTAYNPILFDASAEATENYGNLSITNNTAETKTYDVTYELQYTMSNGATNVQSAGGSAAFTSENWGKLTSTIASSSSTQSVTIAPYSTVSLENYILLGDNIDTTYSNYDAWVSFAVTNVTESTSSNMNSVAVEVEDNAKTVSVSLRNNSDNTITIAAGTTIASEYWSYNYALLTTEPADWKSAYYTYFYIENGIHYRATSKHVFESGKYYSRSKSEITKPSLTISSEVILVPNQSISVGSFTYSGDSATFVVQGSVSGTIVTDGGIDIVNNGQAYNSDGNNAYILNNTSNSYYVRFSGTYSGTDNTNFVTDGSYTYFIGIVRPGQILTIPMSASGTLNSILVSGDYVGDSSSSTTLSTWSISSTVAAAFNNYFINTLSTT